MGRGMSLPITPTPTLTGQDALDFIDKVKEQEDIPAYLIPTPKLDLAVKKMRLEIRKMKLEVLRAKFE